MLKTITAGAIVYLSDEPSIEQSMRLKKGVNPLELVVKEVLTVRHHEGLATWDFFFLNDDSLLMLKTVDNQKDYFLYKYPQFPVQNRQGNLESDNLWLFQAPASENFKPISLKYTTEIKETLEEDGKPPREIIYGIKGQGELSGMANYQPSKLGLDKLLGTVVEYVSKDGEQALILEIGEPNSVKGGAIYLYNLGRQLKPNEVSFL
jgi:hypothetical protein